MLALFFFFNIFFLFLKADSVVCSICGENLSSARDLGLHILAKHCDSNVQEKPAEPGIILYNVRGLNTYFFPMKSLTTYCLCTKKSKIKIIMISNFLDF